MTRQHSAGETASHTVVSGDLTATTLGGTREEALQRLQTRDHAFRMSRSYTPPRGRLRRLLALFIHGRANRS